MPPTPPAAVVERPARKPVVGYISLELARFRATGNPLHLMKAAVLVVQQRRVQELAVSAYWLLRHRPPAALPPCSAEVAQLVATQLPRLFGRDHWSRDAVVAALREKSAAPLAAHRLPPDFAGARRESIARAPGIAVVGEYGEGCRRLCLITADDCHVATRYEDDPRVRHIHAVFVAGDGEVIVTTGDSARYLDRWRVDGARLVFVRRQARSFAGHTAIARVGGRLFLGSDWSSRPNHIETDDGHRYAVPRPASYMYAVAFHVPDGRHLVTLHTSLSVFGRHCAVSVFDTQARRFVHCDLSPEALGACDGDLAAAPIALRDRHGDGG